MASNRREEAYERFKKANELIKGGMVKAKAWKQAKIGGMTWYQFAKEEGIPIDTKHHVKKKKYKPKFVDLHREPLDAPITMAVPRGDNVIIIVCPPHQIQHILGSIK